jgi:hypothetical protein
MNAGWSAPEGSSDHRRMAAARTYQFTLTDTVDPDHDAYDDPELDRRRRLGSSLQRVRARLRRPA